MSSLEYRVLIMFLRVALTGRTIGLGIYDVIAILGTEECRKRITRFIYNPEITLAPECRRRLEQLISEVENETRPNTN